jgi:hypothetical protein
LAEWLLAQFAEDEAVARAATPGPWRVCAEGSEGSRIAPEGGGTIRERSRFLGIMNGRVQPEDGHNATHIARHDPARVLAECESKRGIVEICASDIVDVDGDDGDGWCWEPADWRWHAMMQEDAYRRLKLLALPYADRPGYREEWRP